jgi:hypothetical protein
VVELDVVEPLQLFGEVEEVAAAAGELAGASTRVFSLVRSFLMSETAASAA